MSNEYVFIEGSVSRETDKAVLLNGQWYPKSQISEFQTNGIMVAKWVAEKKSTQAKPSTPPTSTGDFNEEHLVEGTIKVETAKAILLIVKANGKELWFPKAFCKKAHDDGKFIGIVPISWLFKKKVESGEIPSPSNSDTNSSDDEEEPNMDYSNNAFDN